MEDVQTLHSSFFDNAANAFLLFDKDLKLIDVNKAALKLFRFKKEKIAGRHISEISPDVVEKGRYKIYQEVVRTGKPVLLEDIVMHASLGNQTMQIKAFKAGSGLGLAMADVTELRETIDELKIFVEKSNNDMRGPISNITGIADLALNNVKENAAIQYFKIISLQASRLESILQRLREAISIKNEGNTYTLINFQEVLPEIVSSLSSTDGFDDIDIEIRDLTSKKFYTDKTLLVTILKNLVHNAIKYSDEDRKSYIRITVNDESGGVQISVADNGIGIAPQFQKDVFRMFFRATSQSDGIGMGLYTVKNCVKRLNGQISLSSKEGEGSTFTTYLDNEIGKIADSIQAESR